MNTDLVQLSRKIRDRHDKFIAKYGADVSAELSDESFARDTVYSKLILVGKAFERAGVASKAEEVEVRSVGCFYDRSVVVTALTGLPIYLLNGGDHVVVTDRVVTEDPLTRSLVMSGTEDGKNTAHMEYKLVLDEDFDWLIFGMDVLDAIHKVAYHSKSVMKRFVMRALGDVDVIS
jgi:hypothetical protein